MSEQSEYKRGKKHTAEIMKEYRTVKMEGDWLVGYTHSGSKRKLFRKEEMNYKKGYYGGMSQSLRDYKKKHPVKTKKAKKTPVQHTGGFDMGFGKGFDFKF